MPKCDVCRRRPAFYRRTYSGQNLCPICLRRAVEKAVKRAIAEAAVLEPGHTILIPITLSLPYYSQILARLLPHLEKKYSSSVIIVVPEDYNWDPPTAENTRTIRASIPHPREIRDIIDCIRYDRAWSLYYARHYNVDAIAFPLTRTHATLIGMEALLRGRPEALSDSLLALDTSPPTLNPLYHVEAEAVVALGYALQLEPLSPLCRARWLAKEVARRVLPGRPELAFSSGKVLPRLTGLASRSMGRCRVCGGYSSGDVCASCARTGALSFFEAKDLG